MRSALLAVLGADVALVVAGVTGYPAFPNQRGSVGYLAEPVVLLAVYAVVVLAATRSASVNRRRVLRARRWSALLWARWRRSTSPWRRSPACPARQASPRPRR